MNHGPVWISEELVIAVHARQITEHGGSAGIRDKSLLRSALARPQQLYAYGDPSPDIAALAASLAYGIVKNHPFVDGNKRTAAVLCELFIMVNGMSLEASDQEMLSVFLALAGGSLNEEELANWIRSHLIHLRSDLIQEPGENRIA
ncbi:MAG: type II toxin-antitoxin system death-on-curing family toxin [Gammaproteobacteria bacterium]|nr:type II toxin-antitoxin system death-on-curing family toxin [Gammaproteobacteria bacterium]